MRSHLPIFFLINTGAKESFVSYTNIISKVNTLEFSNLQSDYFVGNEGRKMKFYFITNVSLFFYNGEEWVFPVKLNKINITSPLLNDESILLPSSIGLDIIGKYCLLYYGKKKTYLEFNDDDKT